MTKRIELLVHAGAPSNRRDDERYKAQAEAYASFRPSVAIPLGNSTWSEQDDANHLRSQSESTPNAMRPHAAQVFLEDTQLAYTALDSQLLTSSLRLSFDGPPQSESTPVEQRADGLSLARLGKKRKRASQLENAEPLHVPVNVENDLRSAVTQAVPGPESSSQDNISTTSSYLKSPELHRPSKKIKRDARLTRTVSEPVLNHHRRRSTSATSEKLQQAVQPVELTRGHVQRSQDSPGGNQITSELPTSYSLSDITSGSSKVRRSISQRSASDPGPQIGSISPTALRPVPTPRIQAGLPDLEPQRNVSTSNERPLHPPTRPIDDADALPKNNAGQERAAQVAKPAPPRSGPPIVKMSDVNVPTSQSKATTTGQAQPSAEPTIDSDALKDLSSSIRPPQPPPSTEEFKTHVTDPLRFLADNSDVNKAYKPVSTARELRPLERGYWLVRCPEQSETWPLVGQIDFWRFLERTVGKGNSGWGVWCIRNDEDPSTDQRESLGKVKVFCWGEIVQHVYLLLYVASRSKVRRLGLQWIDAEGHVVVQMRDG